MIFLRKAINKYLNNSNLTLIQISNPIKCN